MINDVITNPDNKLQVVATPFGNMFSCANEKTELCVGSGCSAIWGLVYLAIYSLSGYLLTLVLVSQLHDLSLALFSDITLMLLFNWLSPTSGATGAGHKVINALRNNVELTMENVQKQSRFISRPRPALGLRLLLGSFSFACPQLFGRSYGLILMLLGLAALIFSSRLDGLYQWVVSREPSTEQLQEAIEAGQQLYSKTFRIAQIQKYQ